MPTSRMVARVMGGVMIATTASCADGLTAVAEHEQPEGDAPGSEMFAAARARGSWPDHEPAGMRTIFTVDGSTTHFSSEYFHGVARVNENSVRVVSDAASKYGKAIEKRYRIGAESGWNGGVVTTHLPGGPYSELYYRIVFRLSSNWQWHHSGGKYFYYGTTRHSTRGNLGWDRLGRTAWTDFGSGVGMYRANGIPPISRGEYHTIEVHHGASTNGANGFLRMWVDGVRVEDYHLVGHGSHNNVRLENREWLATKGLADKRLDRIQAFMYWGGQRDVKRVNDWVRLSEYYISGKK